MSPRRCRARRRPRTRPIDGRILVRDADHRVVGDGGMLAERVLNRARIDVLTAGDDHVVFAADDEQPPRVVEVAHVAGAVIPSTTALHRRRCSRRTPATTDEHPPGDVRPDRPVVLVENLDRTAGDRPANRLRCSRRSAGVARARWRPPRSRSRCRGCRRRCP